MSERYHITAVAWGKYTDKLAAISDKAAKLMQEYVLRYGFNVDDRMIEYAYSLATKYGEAAGELACAMYDDMVSYWNSSEYRKTLNKQVLEEDDELQKLRDLKYAEMAPTATYEETAIAIRGTAKTSPTDIPSTVGRLVKQTAADTTLQNAARDGAEFAWIPGGNETCAFCMILASRGWQNISKRTLRNGHAEHIHANCNCQYAVSRRGGEEYSDIYDPEEYLAFYEGVEDYIDGPVNWRSRMNAMRRDIYAQNKDMINAQKRAAYKRKQQLDATDGKLPAKEAESPLWQDEYKA